MREFARKNIRYLGLVIALVVWGATAGIVYRNTIRLVETADWNAHRHQVIEGIESTLVALTDAAAAQQGDILAGDERQLERYDTAIQVIDEKVSRLRTLTLDQPK